MPLQQVFCYVSITFQTKQTLTNAKVSLTLKEMKKKIYQP